MKTTWLLILIMTALLITGALSCSDDDDDDSGTTLDDDDSSDDDDITDDDFSDDDDVVDDDDDDDFDDDDDNDTDPGDAIEPTTGFLARQAEYLQFCSDNNGPGQGGLHGQTCRVATGQTTYNETKIYEKITKLTNREDTSDFDMCSFIRMLYLDKETNALPQQLHDDIKDTVLNFKYWIDEPGWDDFCWWSENHQILFHSAELLAGQLYPDEIFPNSGMTGAEHVTHAKKLINQWMDYRGIFGFVEWHSNVYFNEDLPALANVVDFAEDEEIATKAAMLLDILAFDFANNVYKGYYATTHGRTYTGNVIQRLGDSTTEAVWILLGLGQYESAGNFGATAFATSPKYWPPAILEDIALDALDYNEHRERVSIDIAEGPDYGIGYDSYEDVMFWWSATGYAAPEIVSGTLKLVDDFDMWDGWLWRDIAFLRFFVGSDLPPILTGLVEEISRGVALEALSTYTWRTPDYQLSGAQNYKPGNFGGQTHIWQATIDEDAYVFTSYPGGMGDYAGGDWTGGWNPMAVLHENVGIIKYNRKRIPIVDSFLFPEYTHAYFPANEFDEVREPDSHWTFGKKGDAYVGLYSDNPVYWASSSPEDEFELIADGVANTWIVELGSASEDGTFDDFVNGLMAASMTIDENSVNYHSPSLGEFDVVDGGPATIEGQFIDLGPFERWDNAYAQQEFGTNTTVIEFGSQKLKLEFDVPSRRYWTNVTD